MILGDQLGPAPLTGVSGSQRSGSAASVGRGAELSDHVIPVCRVAQDGGGDASAARAGEQAGIGMAACTQERLKDYLTQSGCP